MKKTNLLLILLLTSVTYGQNIFSSSDGAIAFHSATPLQDIDAKSKTATAALNTDSNQVYFKVKNTSFKFPEKLMEEHFNENYMESEKFIFSEFKGKIVEKIDCSKNGEYNIHLVGELTMHGVKKEYNVPAKLKVNGEIISLHSDFNVKLKDHNIEVPTIVFAKISEVIAVKCDINYKPYKKQTK